MPFGLCNAPSTFQRLMNKILSPLLYKGAIVYLDDIIIYSKSESEMLSLLRKVLEILRTASLKLNLKKCKFFCKKVKFLGHIISEEGVGIDPEKVDKVRDWPSPKTVKELQSFLRLAGYYRRFVRNYAKIVRPLTQLTTLLRLKWNLEAEQSFQSIKRSLCSSPILAFPEFSNSSGQFILDVDASGDAMGAVLSQMQDGTEKVIAFGSRTLSRSQRNYGATQRELLALFVFFELFRHYLLSLKFLVRTDHKPLTWLKSSRPNSLLRRWELRISEFDFDSEQRLEEYEFDVEHCAGWSHGNLDALSRRPLNEQPLVAAVLTCNTLSPDLFRSVESLDGQFSSLVSNINQCTCPEEEVIRSWSRFHQQVFAV